MAPAAKKTQQPAVCHGHSRPIVEVNYSRVTPDGYFLVSASKDGQPMLRDGPTGDWIGTFIGHKGAVWSCALDPTATLAATASADFSAKVWDALTGTEKLSFQHGHIVRCCSFADSSTRLATGGMEKLVRIYDLERPDAAPQQLSGAAKGIRNVVWVHGDSLVLTTQQDTPGLDVWDVRSGSIVQTLATEAPVTSVELTFDGRFLTTTDGATIRFWDVGALREAKQHKAAYPVEAASYCPAKGRFACGGGDMWVHLHSYDDGSELEVCKGHHGPVHTIRFGPEGKEYASTDFAAT
ncbi:serine-threonine kinase receptor-associated protein [Monoraphidium neglectum]|uniref:Serine-threonine kinase receptor-associated protein n=1 Tax=Monoraphidium neglectum TaxID=145388 RepID=A0A0D2MUS9_9CHLO|nr:serine-threonine kinase receptor-associated protein [Monoraphidium neglectum]KIZ04267.1 serine-threonine kinase receptor-associated protein [Monoraphidium neglectum]|eukprot:XP_013903286.1 serine-threonine kinase receptor-associated protein [Monoraphidium neglectum]